MPDVTLPQPPPDAPDPGVGEVAERSRVKWAWILVVGMLSLLGLMLTGPLLLPRAKKSPTTGATSNAGQLFLALFEFDVEYGSYPNSSTIPMVLADHPTSLSLGDDSSNELFKQLLVAETANSEAMFNSSPRPDNDFGSDATALAKGECEFAYISGMSSGSGRVPLAFAPILPGKQEVDRKLYDGKAVVLMNDGSAMQCNISPDGKIFISGRDMLDPGHPMWAGQAFEVKWPK